MSLKQTQTKSATRTSRVGKKPASTGKATIKSTGSVASTYEVRATLANMRKVCTGEETHFRVKKSGNLSFIKGSFIPEVAYKHMSHMIKGFTPKGSRYPIRWVPKENVPAFKQMLTKIGMKVEYIPEVVAQ